MKTVISVACVFACVFSLDAQITTTLKHLPDGLDEVRIRNNSATSLVAFVVTVKQVPWGEYSSNAPFVVYSDPLIEPTTRPLPAGDDRMVIASGVAGLDPLGRPRCHGACSRLEEPIVAAGVLANGTTTGDAALLARLLLRRSNMLAAVEMALETLSDAGKHNIPRDRLVEQFKKLANSVSHWYLPPEQQVGRVLYQSIVGKLMDLPEEPVGSPFPPATFVAQETAMLNRQRVTLLESQPNPEAVTGIGKFKQSSISSQNSK
jgi:hypothetical protein